ncbi:hypothetical protein MSG28_001170 [Choristoneura fumiferana]|uniref:Uncharacterized protein n=1 Tax=Choristoneura fumiferana TaxID=7141 RepID=A0ACC0K431_CHOFU|nr:hypothetical protein MSG28_001170 [Choristoneura fumiferana]
MSLRGTKRASGVRGEEAGASKRRRMEPEDALWQLRPASDLKRSSIYNRSASEAPAELFRKDLISAMKLPDSEPLTASEYWVITDTWKQDWERGVQVPVNPDSLPAPKVRTWDKIQAIMKSEEGLGIEYDENVICDVCRSPDSEDGNEMVFCDSCNICGSGCVVRAATVCGRRACCAPTTAAP